MDQVTLECFLDDGLSRAEIGRRVGRHEATVAYWVARYGLRATGSNKHSPRGALAREKLESLIAAGLSIAQIADQVGRSKATVRHWLAKYELKTAAVAGRRRTATVSDARERGLNEVDLACVRHGDTRFVSDVRGYYRCAKCRSASVSRRRRRVKEILVQEAGGECRICGYARCVSALEFHHRVPAEKRFGLASQGLARSLGAIRVEAEKCVLLCSNCHAEVEAGISSLGSPGAA
jgi:transposase